jgi:hypothetical protein
VSIGVRATNAILCVAATPRRKCAGGAIVAAIGRPVASTFLSAGSRNFPVPCSSDRAIRHLQSTIGNWINRYRPSQIVPNPGKSSLIQVNQGPRRAERCSALQSVCALLAAFPGCATDASLRPFSLISIRVHSRSFAVKVVRKFNHHGTEAPSFCELIQHS